MSLRSNIRGTRLRKWLGAGLLPLALSWGAAQTNGQANKPTNKQPTGQTQTGGQTQAGQTAAPLPAVSKGATRAELLDLLGQVQTQLQELGAEAQPGDGTDAQLAELRSQLEVLLLQAQLERLQRENKTLQQKLAASGTAASNSTSEEAKALEQQLKQLKARQDNMNAQMEVIAHQHAEILEYSGLDEAQTHTVQVGDSLSGLALEYYNDPTRWTDILAANPDVTDPDILIPGTTLTIPADADPSN